MINRRRYMGDMGTPVTIFGVPPITTNKRKLLSLKAFGGTEQRNLPDGYIEQQFIHMMDGSYLLTDIVPTYDGHYEMDFQTTTVSTVAAAYLGGRADRSPAGLIFSHGSGNVLVTDAFGQQYSIAYRAENNTRYKYVFNNKVFTLYKNGEVVETHTFTSSADSGDALAIKAINMGGSIDFANEGIYLYGFKAWNAQGELIADYVPAVQKGTVPVVGFYDTVSGTFKTATAGTFAAGGEAVPTPDAPMDIWCNNGVLKARHQSGLPLDYTLLDYIGSSGTQYIDTGITDITNSEFEVVAQQTSISGSFPTILGALDDDSNFKVVCGLSTLNNTFYSQMGNGAGYIVSSVSNDLNKHTFKVTTSSGQQTLQVDDNAAVVGSYAITDTTQYSLTVCARNKATVSNFTKQKVFSVLIKKNGTLVRNLVPCKNASNIVGMYDTVNGVFYQNAGTGNFTAGSAVSDPVEIYADGTVETINVHTKNLYNPATAVDACLTDTGGLTLSIQGKTSAFIQVKPSTAYTLKFLRTAQDIYTRVCSYDENEDFLTLLIKDTDLTEGYKTETFTTDANAKYIRVSFKADSTEVQLEQGSTATEYVPYFNGGTATAEMLLKVGTYTDQQEIIDGTVTRKVGVKVLDGTESWTMYNGGAYFNMSPYTADNTTVAYCSHYKYVGPGINIADMNNNEFVFATTNHNVSFKSTQTASTLSAWTTWLAAQYAAGTPVIIVYPLATPTTESVAGQTLKLTRGTNIIDITQASLDKLELEVVVK